MNDTHFVFTDDFLSALGAWQRGWREDPARREELARRLVEFSSDLPATFKAVSSPSFRKRFLYPKDLPALFFGGDLKEGVTSWTTDFKYAQNFKGLQRPDAVTAAIFAAVPTPDQVVLSTTRLWESSCFRDAVHSYVTRGMDNHEAIINFADKQSEVVLDLPLAVSDIVGFTAKPDPFDDLCGQAGIDDPGERDRIYKTLTSQGKFPDEFQWMFQAAALRVVSRVQGRVDELFDKLKRKPPATTV